MDPIDILENQAVDAAINLQWNDAIKLNEQILEIDKDNLAAYLRLGFSYLQTNNLQEAKKYYNKALKRQPKNQVALENLERIEILEEGGSKKTKIHGATLNPNLFLEVPGKTKSVGLVNLGQKNALAELSSGQVVEMKLKKRRLEIRTTSGEYIGSLPDDLSKRLIFFLEADSEYIVYVKEASVSRVVVFIREEKKGKKVSHFSSFPPNIHTNLDQMGSNQDEGEEIEEDNEDQDEIEKMANSLGEKEETEEMNIPPIQGEEESEE